MKQITSLSFCHRYWRHDNYIICKHTAPFEERWMFLFVGKSENECMWNVGNYQEEDQESATDSLGNNSTIWCCFSLKNELRFGSLDLCFLPFDHLTAYPSRLPASSQTSCQKTTFVRNKCIKPDYCHFVNATDIMIWASWCKQTLLKGNKVNSLEYSGNEIGGHVHLSGEYNAIMSNRTVLQTKDSSWIYSYQSWECVFFDTIPEILWGPEIQTHT